MTFVWIYVLLSIEASACKHRLLHRETPVLFYHFSSVLNAITNRQLLFLVTTINVHL